MLVVDILMSKYGMSEDEAKQRVAEVNEAFEQVRYNPDMCEEILLDELGLEPDYIFDIVC